MTTPAKVTGLGITPSLTLGWDRRARKAARFVTTQEPETMPELVASTLKGAPPMSCIQVWGGTSDMSALPEWQVQSAPCADKAFLLWGLQDHHICRIVNRSSHAQTDRENN